jgi:hypothetical protein
MSHPTEDILLDSNSGVFVTFWGVVSFGGVVKGSHSNVVGQVCRRI